MMYKILLVEDDKNISEMLCDYFTEKSSNKIIIDVADNGKKWDYMLSIEGSFLYPCEEIES